jgi:hypothetical protein
MKIIKFLLVPLIATSFLFCLLGFSWEKSSQDDKLIEKLIAKNDRTKQRLDQLINKINRNARKEADIRRRNLMDTLDQLEGGFNKAQFREALAEALLIAQAYNIDTVKLDALYGVSKGIIKRIDLTPKNKIELYKEFESLYGTNRAIRQRKDLNAKASVAYLHALLVPDADQALSNYSRYVNAIRQFQNSEQFLRESESLNLQAEQQLARDVMSAVPLLGEALDIYGACWGTDAFTGEKFSEFTRGLDTFLILAPDALAAVVKKTPGLLKKLNKYSDALDAAMASAPPGTLNKLKNVKNKIKKALQEGSQEYTSKSFDQLLDKRDMDKLATLCGDKNIPVEDLRKKLKIIDGDEEMLSKVLANSDSADEFVKKYNQAVLFDDLKVKMNISSADEELASKILAASSSPDEFAKKFEHAKMMQEVRDFSHKTSKEYEKLDKLLANQKKLDKAIEKADKNLEDVFKQADRTQAIETSNILEKHAEAFSEVAQDRGETFIMRPVNADSKKLIENGAFTKNMHVKAKSSNWGPHRGAIPADPRFSKLKNASPDEIKKYEAYVQESLDKGWVQKQDLKIDGMDVVVVKTKTNENMVLFKNDAGEYLDEGKKLLDKKQLKNIVKNSEEPMQVLAAPGPKGKPLTADYDFLAIGGKREQGIEHWDDMMGGITNEEKKAIIELDQAMGGKTKVSERVNTVHHGTEARFPNRGSKPDYPLTAFQPDGKVITIPKGPKGDPDMYLKRYFHRRRLEGENINPNPFWGWGKYDPKKGWK